MPLTEEARMRLEAQTCSEKVPYPSWWQAQDVAERHIACWKCRTNRRRMGVYRCPSCSLWHLGHSQ